jgi:tetratricopeptide (TPR) repeat protein
MENLRQLDLSSNRFFGAIPPEIARSRSLSELSLASNQLSGPLPRHLGVTSGLSLLDLSKNQLSGTFQHNATHFYNLGELYLYGNQLSGDIPTGPLVGLIRGTENEHEIISDLERIAPDAVNAFIEASDLLARHEPTWEDLRAAADGYARVLELAPSFDVALRRRGIALARWTEVRSRVPGKENLQKEALTLLEKAVELRPSRENLFWLARELGEIRTWPDDALARNERILAIVEEIIPTYPRDTAALRLGIEAAEAVARKRDDSQVLQRALALSKLAVAADPTDPQLLYMHGSLLAKVGEWEQLRQLIHRVQQDLPSSNRTEDIERLWSRSPEAQRKRAARDRERAMDDAVARVFDSVGSVIDALTGRLGIMLLAGAIIAALLLLIVSALTPEHAATESEVKTCRRAILLSGIVALFFAIVSGAFATASLYVTSNDPMVKALLSPFLYIDAVLLTVLGVLVLRRSRVAAAVLVVYLVGFKVVEWVETQSLQGWPTTIVVTLIYVRGLIATVRWHHLLKAERRAAFDQELGPRNG